MLNGGAIARRAVTILAAWLTFGAHAAAAGDFGLDGYIEEQFAFGVAETDEIILVGCKGHHSPQL